MDYVPLILYYYYSCFYLCFAGLLLCYDSVDPPFSLSAFLSCVPFFWTKPKKNRQQECKIAASNICCLLLLLSATTTCILRIIIPRFHCLHTFFCCVCFCCVCFCCVSCLQLLPSTACCVLLLIIREVYTLEQKTVASTYLPANQPRCIFSSCCRFCV